MKKEDKMIRLEPRLYVRWLYQQRHGIISVLQGGQLYLAQREFDHLCEKAQWPKAICSYVLFEKEI